MTTADDSCLIPGSGPPCGFLPDLVPGTRPGLSYLVSLSTNCGVELSLLNGNLSSKILDFFLTRLSASRAVLHHPGLRATDDDLDQSEKTKMPAFK